MNVFDESTGMLPGILNAWASCSAVALQSSRKNLLERLAGFKLRLGAVPLRAFLAALVLFASSVHAQDFAIKSFVVAGGGGTSTGGLYALSGTVGQHDASYRSGNNLVLDGGFWSGVSGAEQVVAPTLSVMRSGSSNIIISWEPATPGFVLQVTKSLSQPEWSDVSTSGANQVIVPLGSQTEFFWLRQQ